MCDPSSYLLDDILTVQIEIEGFIQFDVIFLYSIFQVVTVHSIGHFNTL